MTALTGNFNIQLLKVEKINLNGSNTISSIDFYLGPAQPGLRELFLYFIQFSFKTSVRMPINILVIKNTMHPVYSKG